MAEKRNDMDYLKLRRRLGALRKAYWRYMDNWELKKAAALLPRIKILEAEEPRLYEEFLRS